MDKPSHSFDRRGAAPLFSIALVLLLAAACLFGIPARAAAVCTPLGGAPGPMPGLGAETGQGAIGPGTSPIGGRSPGEVVSELVGASSPPACQASGSSASGAAEPASLPPASPGASAGNPVNLVTGNKYERRIDVVMPDPESGLREALVQALGDDALRVLAAHWPAFAPLGLIFSRHYNSRFDAAGPMGPGWRHAYETALARLKGRHGVELQVVQADGRRIVFRRSEPRGSRAEGGEEGGGVEGVEGVEGVAAGTNVSVASHFVSDREQDGEIEEDLSAAAPWRWRWPDGRVLVFDGEGRLARIDAPDHDHVVVQRDRSGRIRSLVDAHGRRLQLEYLGKRLHAVVLPDGNRIAYDYDRHGVLVAVRYPDGRVVRYGYDDPRAFHLLTSIGLPDGSTSRYRYDDALRVAESAPASAPQDAVSFEYRLPGAAGESGRTVVRQGDRTSTWHWEVDERGRERILSMSGDGCASCPVLDAASARAEPASSRAAELTGRGPESATPRSDPVIELKRDALGLPAEARVAGLARTGDGRSTPIAIHVRWQRHLAGPLTGKLSWVERLGPDGAAARTSFFHDARRSLVTVVQPGGLIHRFERDALGRATAQQRPHRARVEARFDSAWRLVSWRVRGELAEIGWGQDGRPSSIAWPSGDRWTLQFRSGGVELRSNRGWVAGTGDPAVERSAERSDSGDSRETVRGAAVALVFGGAQPLVVDAAGRSTRYRYDDFGRLVEVDSSASGYRRFRHDAWGRVIEVDSPLGVIERRRYDLAGRLTEREQLAGSERIVTRFEWDGALLVGVEHPVQRTRVEHDAAGLVSAIEHRLLGRVQRWSFERDDRDRVIARGMPDGDRVIYRYDETGRPSALAYQAPGGGRVSIVDAVRFQVDRAVAWRLGNGVRFERADDAGGRPLAWRWRGSAPLPEWRYRWGEDGLPAAIVGRDDERRFGWDALGRLIVQERHSRDALQRRNAPDSEYFAWDLVGDLRLVKNVQGLTRRDAELAPPRDALGRPARHGDFDLRYGAQQRIVAIDRGSEPIARYSYNASGERAIKTVGAKTAGFLYRGRRLAAETDADGKISRHYLYWLGNPMAIVERRGDQSRVFWLHGDHLGTPHAATDAFGRQVWQASLDAFGRLANERGRLHQPLRFAGQYHDTETGLHDNYLRTYDPAAARYLEPDPIGLSGGLNPYAYVDGNPLMATDPLGLILFAFDGTNNGDPPRGKDDVSNVRKFFLAYNRQARWYMTGVGLNDPDSGITTNRTDALTANTAQARVDYMMEVLDRYIDHRVGETIDIDVVGYSRGAAMALDFVNRIADLESMDYWFKRGVCVNLRFLGLWDTVAQFGLNGSETSLWRLGVPSGVKNAYHAIALNEHRSYFPSERPVGAAVIERGFVGSHADVGGGNSEGDLSDVTLIWMTKMAQDAGADMLALPEAYLSVSSPLLHDRDDLKGDRAVRTRNDQGQEVASVIQRAAQIPGMDWQDSLSFIRLYPQPRRGADGSRSIVGEVDMQAYSDWLQAEYGIQVRGIQ